MPQVSLSFYYKRWWNSNLSALIVKFSNIRNQTWRFKKQSQRHLFLEADVLVEKFEYQKSKSKAQKQHWEYFSKGTQNIWQAARSLGETEWVFTIISKLKDEFTNKKVTNEEEIATML